MTEWDDLADAIRAESDQELERIILDNEMKQLEQTVPEFPI